MEIKVRIKEVYGNENIYPGCERAKMRAELTGNKTFTPANVQLLKRLGFSFTVEQKTI